MIIVLPTTVEVPDAQAGRRTTPVTWLLAALVIAWVAADRLAVWSLGHGAALLGEEGVRAITGLAAAMRLSTDPALFAPWQLWTATLLHAGWWHLAVGAIALIGPARALERRLGPAPLAAAVLAIAPLATAAMAFAAGAPLAAPAVPGLSGVVSALIVAALAIFPRSASRWDAAWYLVRTVGWRPLLRMDLVRLWLLFVLADACRAVLADDPLPLPAHLVGALAGGAYGWVARRMRGP